MSTNPRSSPGRRHSHITFGSWVIMFSLNLLSTLQSARSFGFRTSAPTQLLHNRRLAALSSTTTALKSTATTDEPIPMTLLAGFLGTGKTTTLKHLLENTENYRIGVIVNDVASVNIDAKLIANQSDNGILQLENGCACCSLADELFFSVEKLVKGSDKKFDALVIELSGVADPMAIRNNWKMAPVEVRQMADISKVVTVIDTQTFGSDYMTWDMIVDRKGWTDPADSCAANVKVSELLAEQTEAADIVLLNKIDLAGEEQVKVASKVANALNSKATFIRSEFGKVSPSELLGGSTAAAIEEAESCTEPGCTDESHSHAHSHDHAAESKSSSHDHAHDHDCAEPACTDSSHSHAHDHDCAEPDCTDSSHSHSHDHDASCSDPGCTDSSHSHSHDHDASCADPDCTDTSHSHSHDHATSTDSLGISNFVYKSSRPFNTKRLLKLLNRWPIPKKEVLDLEFWEDKTKAVDMFGKSTEGNPFVGVLRTKGFCWFAPNKWDGMLEDAWRHDTAMYWSHAGRHMSVNTAGKWWATIPKKTLPKYFEDDNKAELDRILREDFVSEEFGDRRQELVFIGVDIDEPAIREALDKCLLSDDELNTYRQQLNNFQMATMTAMPTTTSGGLFDVDGTEHLDQK